VITFDRPLVFFSFLFARTISPLLRLYNATNTHIYIIYNIYMYIYIYIYFYIFIIHTQTKPFPIRLESSLSLSLDSFLFVFLFVCYLFVVQFFFCVYIYNVCIGIQLRLSSLCLFTIFELLSSIEKERRTFYSQVVRSPPIVPVIQQADGFSI